MRLDQERETRFFAGIEEATRFFRGESDVHRTLEKIARLLEGDGIPYAIIGAMALNAYGYRRVTRNVDLLLTRESLEAVQTEHPDFASTAGVPVQIWITGEYPGDSQPKPVAFPDPATAAVRGDRIALLPLPRLIELKLASGMTAPHRLKDLADVLEMVRILGLPRSLVEDLHPFVRDKYREIWQAAQVAERE